MEIFSKSIVPHSDFYIAQFSKEKTAPYLLFIHGGPGLNCGVLEYLIEQENFFQSLNYNLIVYDQRNCGRSKKQPTPVLHSDNISDFHVIYQELIKLKLDIKGFIAHSYGAKLLFDYSKQFGSTLPAIFVSTADSILMPRLNNLILDLNYLKKTSPTEYNESLEKMNPLTLQKIWEITEHLTPLFQQNKDRPYFYWANMNIYEKFLAAQKRVNLPISNETFMSVRKDLYSNERNFSVAIETIQSPYLWINGFHDYIMNGSESLIKKSPHMISFTQSSHYPHLEENEHFCELVNAFITKN